MADRDSDWAIDSATSQSVTGYHCDVQDVTMCNTDGDQSQFMRSSENLQADKMSVEAGKRHVEEQNRDSSRRGRTAE